MMICFSHVVLQAVLVSRGHGSRWVGRYIPKVQETRGHYFLFLNVVVLGGSLFARTVRRSTLRQRSRLGRPCVGRLRPFGVVGQMPSVVGCHCWKMGER